MTKKVWKLWQGEDLLADLVVTDGDFPWLIARVETTPAFEWVRELFERDDHLSDQYAETAQDELLPLLEEVDAQIRQAVRLTYPEGHDVPEFLLHIVNGETAHWRWSDEPFKDEGPASV